MENDVIDAQSAIKWLNSFGGRIPKIILKDAIITRRQCADRWAQTSFTEMTKNYTQAADVLEAAFKKRFPDCNKELPRKA